jgi:hypothetical protein
MFFRRKRVETPTFRERLENARRLGFTEETAGGETRIARGNCAIDVRNENDIVRASSRAGMLLGGEIAALVDGGFQKFLRTPSGKRRPATAEDLEALHAFEEDLKEALGEQSYYNESLGTVSTFYLYDRVENRDRGAPKRVWE